VTAAASANAPALDVLPAPGADRHVALDLVNSAIAVPGGHVLDLLGTPDGANAWLTDRDLAPRAFGMREQCAAQLRALREQLRALVAAHVDELPPPDSALAAVNDAMTRVPTASLLRWDAERGLRREASHPVTQALDHALAALAVDAADLLTGPMPTSSRPAAPRPASATCSAPTAAGSGAPCAAATGCAQHAPTRDARPAAAPPAADTTPDRGEPVAALRRRDSRHPCQAARRTA
jgi:hypothetical protein